MYGISKNISLDFFIGKQFIQLCIGQFEFGLNFEDKISISIYGEFSINNKHYLSQEETHEGYILQFLLGKKIISANHGEKNGDIIIRFESKDELIIHDSETNFESYHLSTPNGVIVV